MDPHEIDALLELYQIGPPIIPAADTPNCPKCSKAMRLRTAKQGGNAGSKFWWCCGYPERKGTRKYAAGSSGAYSRAKGKIVIKLS
ncbi:MAG: hypothetical protein WAT41_12025 [Flavobacteriales bacterium]